MFSEVTVSEQHSVNKMGTGWHKPMSLQHQCDPNQVCTGNANKCMQAGKICVIHNLPSPILGNPYNQFWSSSLTDWRELPMFVGH